MTGKVSSAIAQQILFGFLFRIIGSLAGFATTAYILRNLDAASAASYFVAISVISIASCLGMAGLHTAIVQKVPILLSDEAVVPAGRYLYGSICAGLAISSFVCFSLIFAFMLQPDVFPPSLRDGTAAILLFTSIPLSVLTAILSYGAQAFGHPKHALFLSSLCFGSFFLFFLSLLRPDALISIVACYVLAQLATTFVAFFILRPHLVGWPPSDFKRTAMGGLAYLQIHLTLEISTQTVPLFLAYLSSPLNISVFAISMKIAMIFASVQSLVSRVYMPLFSVSYSKSDFLALRRSFVGATLCYAALAIPMCASVVFFSGTIITFFNPSLAPFSYVLVVVVLGQVGSSAFGPGADFLSMVGHADFVRNALVMTAVASALLSLFLIPSYGALGAAFVYSASLIAHSASCLIKSYRLLQRRAT